GGVGDHPIPITGRPHVPCVQGAGSKVLGLDLFQVCHLLLPSLTLDILPDVPLLVLGACDQEVSEQTLRQRLWDSVLPRVIEERARGVPLGGLLSRLLWPILLTAHDGGLTHRPSR